MSGFRAVGGTWLDEWAWCCTVYWQWGLYWSLDELTSGQLLTDQWSASQLAWSNMIICLPCARPRSCDWHQTVSCRFTMGLMLCLCHLSWLSWIWFEIEIKTIFHLIQTSANSLLRFLFFVCCDCCAVWPQWLLSVHSVLWCCLLGDRRASGLLKLLFQNPLM